MSTYGSFRPIWHLVTLTLCAAVACGGDAPVPSEGSSTVVSAATEERVRDAGVTPANADALSAPDATTQRSSDPRGLLAKVVVEGVDLDFAITSGSDRASLWDTFANQPYHEQFSSISTRSWYANWQLYKARILELAGAGGFDAESLARCFRQIEPAEDADIAFLPIGAFLARRGAEPVWIIVVNWEWSPNSSNFAAERRPVFANMGHIRAWAFSVPDCEQIDYMTCG